MVLWQRMKWIDAILMNSKSAGTVRLVLLVLGRGANANGFVRLPLGFISRVTGRSQTSVREALDKLCDFREIKQVEAGGGNGKATTYRITICRAITFPKNRLLPLNYFANGRIHRRLDEAHRLSSGTR